MYTWPEHFYLVARKGGSQLCKNCISYFFFKNSNMDTNLASNFLIVETAWCNMCNIIVARAKQCSNKINFTFICQNSTQIFRSGKFCLGLVKYCSSQDGLACKIVLPLRSVNGGTHESVYLPMDIKSVHRVLCISKIEKCNRIERTGDIISRLVEENCPETAVQLYRMRAGSDDIEAVVGTPVHILTEFG